MWNRRQFLFDNSAGLWLTATDGREIKIRILDDGTSRPTAARVRLLDAQGAEVIPIGHPTSLAENAVEGDVSFNAK